jgi:hypothetical protein
MIPRNTYCSCSIRVRKERSIWVEPLPMAIQWGKDRDDWPNRYFSIEINGCPGDYVLIQNYDIHDSNLGGAKKAKHKYQPKLVPAAQESPNGQWHTFYH